MSIKVSCGVKLLKALNVCALGLLPPDVLALLLEGRADSTDAVASVVGTGVAISGIVISWTLKYNTKVR